MMKLNLKLEVVFWNSVYCSNLHLLYYSVRRIGSWKLLWYALYYYYSEVTLSKEVYMTL